MDIDIYLEPSKITPEDLFLHDKRERLGHFIYPHTSEKGIPSLDGISLALVGVHEGRKSMGNNGCTAAPDAIRTSLYLLFPPVAKPMIADLGNIRRGNSVEDTWFAVTEVASYLLRKGIIPIILGGSQDITWAVYKAYEKIGQVINILSIDNMFDLGDTESELNSETWLGKVITSQPNYLFNYTNIGYQTYFTDSEAIALMDKLYFDICRLGVARTKMSETEPLLRNADMISFDISSVRFSDACGNANATPNGFFADEVCQMARYAGLSEKLSTIGFYEMNPEYDRQGQTAMVIAQMIWFFIDGFFNRKNEYPYKEKDQFKKYYVSIKDNTHEIIFYKSPKSDRWWMEIPSARNADEKIKRHFIVPCSYTDYQTALEDEVPDRWWQFYKKLV